MPTKSTTTPDPIVQRLRALVKESPDLKDAAQIYEAILPLLRDTDLHVASVSLTPEHVRAKMENGLSLLHDLDLELDTEAVRELMLKLAAAVETAGKKKQPHKLLLPWMRTSNESDAAASSVRRALEEKKLDISALLPHIAVDESGTIISAARSLGLDPDLVRTLTQNALKPALRAWCRQLTPLARGSPWHKGTCFVCGAVATLAELQDNDQVKHLRCGQCGADWVFRRLQCVYCGNEDHRTLRYLYDESRQEKMRVEVCDKCRGYLKVINSFDPTPPEMLTVEDLKTLHLDYIAESRGYGRDTVW
jgi:FdhE protein